MLKLHDPTTAEILKHSKVLVVDDQRLNHEILKAEIGDEYTLFSAHSAEEGLQAIEAIHPDLILMDVVMPGMDGIEVCKRIKQDEVLQDIPVMFVTSLDSHESENRCWEAGAVDFIRRPVNMETLRHRVNVHLMLKFQSDLLRKMAYLDGLTGIYNRRYFDLQYRMHIRQNLRTGDHLSLLLLDVDFFKLYNDSQGHLAGDDCLKLLAKSLRGCATRPLDCCARYGGEEFAVLLPDTNFDGALSIAGEIVRSVEDMQIPHPESPYKHVTVSAGVATTHHEAEPDLIITADRALYDAKRGGRNTAAPKFHCEARA